MWHLHCFPGTSSKYSCPGMRKEEGETLSPLREKKDKVKILFYLASCFTSAPSSGIFSVMQAKKKGGGGI